MPTLAVKPKLASWPREKLRDPRVIAVALLAADLHKETSAANDETVSGRGYITADPISVAEHVQRWTTLRTVQHLPQFRDEIVGLGGIADLDLVGSTLPPLELNPYAALANNPLRWTDPTGESIIDGFGGLGGLGGLGGSSASGGRCEDPKKEKNCAALRDNIINQTCKSIANPKKKFACFAAAWATYLACLAE